MQKLTRDRLQTLEAYAKARPDFRVKVMAHKKNRQVNLDENVSLIFEDELTIRYQIQEVLRSEKIFEEEGISEEINAYNPLIPDGKNWKATMLLSYTDVEERKRKLASLVGVEHKVWVRISGCEKVYGVADEDLERSTELKTSAVHFLRFELTQPMADRIKQGSALAAGIDHPALSTTVDPINPATRDALAADLE